MNNNKYAIKLTIKIHSIMSLFVHSSLFRSSFLTVKNIIIFFLFSCMTPYSDFSFNYNHNDIVFPVSSSHVPLLPI
jgi:hypothetical protein